MLNSTHGLPAGLREGGAGRLGRPWVGARGARKYFLKVPTQADQTHEQDIKTFDSKLS